MKPYPLHANELNGFNLNIVSIYIKLLTFFNHQDMFSGGTDTSSITIEWALAELVANPDKMERLQDELTKVIGNTRSVDISDLPDLPYLSAVIKETMRMHPVVPLLVPHMLTETCELNGYEVLAGTQAYINMWAIGHDSNVWDNPWQFHPERFLGADKISLNGGSLELAPFGSGRRICPGLSLAVLSMEFILASLVHSFEWKVNGKPNLNEMCIFVLKLDTPLVIRAYPRLASGNLVSSSKDVL